MKSPIIPIKVYRWKSADDKELLTFDNIYQDFTIEDAVNRVGTSIKEGDPFYAWVGDKPLLFNIPDVKWDGYNVNPFKSRDHTSPQLDEPISYDYHNKDLFIGLKTFNIVFSGDLPKQVAKNKYYFTDLKPLTARQYKKQDEKLASLVRVDASNIKMMTENFTRINYHCKLKNIVLANLFDNMHTSKYIDMIQWIDDSSRVLYKLFKRHKIKKEWFMMWTNIEKASKTNAINLYSVVNRAGYCKITIDSQNNVLFNYVFDARSSSRLKDILHHKKHMLKILENNVKQKIALKELAINASVRMEAHNSVFKTLIKKIGEYIDIFHVIKSDIVKNKMSITCTYKRSSNYAQNTDIYDYIRSRLALGLGRQEIAEELNNLGVQGNIDDMIMGEMSMASQSQIDKEKNKISLTNNGTIVVIQPYNTGYVVSITNCPNYKEMQYMLFWLQKIVFGTVNAKAAAANAANAAPVALPAAITEDDNMPSNRSDKSDKSNRSDDVNQDDIDFDLDSLGGGCVSGGCLGGAVGKSSYLITMLQQADKDLFGENYARDKCQNPSQPIVLTREEKEKLEKNNQLHFDNIIEYGSSPSIQNYYACPRLWCPQSKVPLPVDDPNAKCPLDNEKPMQMIWNNDITKKRFVKLIKPNEKGMCVPCCMKKEPKADEINKCKANMSIKGQQGQQSQQQLPSQPKPEPDAGEQYYIMNQPAPIPSGRFGIIPENLHNVLFNGSVSVDQCTKAIQKSQPCFVRKGIQNSRYDSVVLAMAEVLGFKKKKDFVKDIKKRLDITIFLSLGNGEVCKQFMNMEEIVVDQHPKLAKSFKAFKEQNPKLCKGFDDVSNVGRTLNIYYAYKKYIDYIEADDFHMEKTDRYLQPLVAALYGINPLIWEKLDRGNELYLQCPGEYVALDLVPTVCMLLKEGKYYEPVELKSRGTAEGVKVFKLNELPIVQNVIMSNCVSPHIVYDKLYAFNNWIKSKVSLQNAGNFVLKKVLINNDLSISKILTAGNVMLEFDTLAISYLPLLMKNFGIQSAIFYDDLVGKKLKIKMLRNDLDVFAKKCGELGIRLNAGNMMGNDSGDGNGIEINSVLTLQPAVLPPGLIIHTSNFKGYQPKDKWYELQKMVGMTLLKKYTDDQFEEIKKMSRSARVQRLLKDFSDKLPHKNIIKIILEEIPLNSGEIKRWLTNTAINSKYDFLSSKIDQKKTEFVFSQNAFIVNGIKIIPQKLLLGYHNAMPNANANASFEKDMTPDTQFDDITVNNPVAADRSDTSMPDMLTKGKAEKLGSKWIMHKKSKWSNMVYMKTEYDRDLLAQFVNWLSHKLGMALTYDDVLGSARQLYFDILDNKDAMFTILQDQSFFGAWLEVSKRKLPTVQMFWDQCYSKLTSEQRKNYMNQILSKGMLYPNDLHIEAISKLFNVSILTLHRGKYGKFDSANVRGDLGDLVVSSTLFSAANNVDSRPLIIFNKINEKKYSGYYLVVEANDGKPLYMKLSEVPANVRVLVDAQLQM